MPTNFVTKKRISTVIALLLLLLAACNSLTPTPGISTKISTGIHKATATPAKTAGSQTLTPQLTADTLGVKPEDLKFVRVTLWHPWSGEEGKALAALIDTFNSTNEWGIQAQVEWIGNNDDIDTGFRQAVNSGNLPQLVVGYTFQAQAWSDLRPIILDWQPYFANPNWGTAQNGQDAFLPVIQQSDVVKQVRWGVPAKRIGQVLAYNQSLAKELGFTQPPRTPQDLKKQACANPGAASTPSPTPQINGNGLAMATDYSSMLGWFFAFGATIQKGDDPGYQFNTNEVQQAFKFLRELVDGGCVQSLVGIDLASAFASRQVLFASIPTTAIADLLKSNQDAGFHDTWTVIPFPNSSSQPTLEVYGPSYILVESSPAQQLGSWLLVKWLLQPENQEKLLKASLALPLDSVTLKRVQSNSQFPAQYLAAVDYLPQATSEPNLKSWDTVRWAVSDAAKQLFAWYFTSDQTPNLAKLLDNTAADLNSQAK